jgi:L-seryl-tRNA(Ser) seleniumtransferase
MDPARSRLLRQLPGVDELLRHPSLAPLVASLPRPWAAAALRRALEAERRRLTSCPAAELPSSLNEAALLKQLAAALREAGQASLRRVINATGVVIHTNLGRSLLAEAALAQLREVAAHYSTLEYNLARGARGSRQDLLEGLLKELTGCEGALIVNNNAAAVLLALNTLAKDKEVVISRGQLVEIGGSFRLPEIMRVSGALLREVGTTNKTYLHDYERAINSETALLLKVHPSNFRILGFAHEVELPELVALGRKYDLPVLEDLGSGCLVDLSRFGREKEPTVQEALRAGADLVLFSGDKLLGGPQAGLALGSREVVARLRQNPLARALRPDKLTLAALEATLRLYLEEPRALAEIPTLRSIIQPVPLLRRRARSLARSLKARLPRLQVEVRPSEGRVGGGALPQAALPSFALALNLPPLPPHQLEALLRRGDPPVISRLEQGAVLLDVLTLQAEDRAPLLAALAAVAKAAATPRP